MISLKVKRNILFVIGLLGFVGGVSCLGCQDWILGIAAIAASVFFLTQAENVRKEMDGELDDV